MSALGLEVLFGEDARLSLPASVVRGMERVGQHETRLREPSPAQSAQIALWALAGLAKRYWH